MSIQDGTCEFLLTRGVDYKHQGSTVTANSITLKEPGMDHIKYYSKLAQMIKRSELEMIRLLGFVSDAKGMVDAIGEVTGGLEKEAKKIESESEGLEESIFTALTASESIDLSDFIETFKNMACLKGRSSVCLVDGTEVMTPFIWNNLKPDDAINMAVKWCSFFVMPSEGGEKTSSGQPSELHTGRMEA